MEERLLKVLACPACRSGLEKKGQELVCASCRKGYPVNADGQAILLTGPRLEDLEESAEAIRQKSSLHQFYRRHQQSRLLNTVRKIIRPLTSGILFVYLRRSESALKTLFPGAGAEKVVIDVGAGNNPIHPDAFTLDLYQESGADIIARIENLPFADNSLDGLVSCGVIEHLKNPWKTAEEMKRVVKPGGYIYAEIPLLQGIHYNPFDEQRFTPDGLETLFQPLITVEKGVASGPGSALAHLLPIWLAMILSFRSKILYEMLFLFFSWITFPIKYTDFFLLNHPEIHRAPFGVYYFGRKQS